MWIMHTSGSQGCYADGKKANRVHSTSGVLKDLRLEEACRVTMYVH